MGCGAGRGTRSKDTKNGALGILQTATSLIAWQAGPCAEPGCMSELSVRKFLAVSTRDQSKELVPRQRRLDGKTPVLFSREFGLLLSDSSFNLKDLLA